MSSPFLRAALCPRISYMYERLAALRPRISYERRAALCPRISYERTLYRK